MEYTTGTKATWRYWAWKRLREKLKVHPSFATVVFLAGPSPEDLAAASKNGFKVSNIIAIDRDEIAVKAARKAGCTAIQGDIHNVVEHWDDGEIHGCIADYCCGLSYEQFNLSTQMAMKVSGPIVLNFQRGRESSEATTRMRNATIRLGIETKHRGEQFMWWNVLFAIAACSVSDEVSLDDCLSIIDTIGSGDEQESSRIMLSAEARCAPMYYSYRSNAVMMDTVALHGMSCGSLQKKQDRASMLRRNAREAMSSMSQYSERALNKEAAAQGGDARQLLDEVRQSVKLLNKLSAMKAVRTMNGAVRYAAKQN